MLESKTDKTNRADRFVLSFSGETIHLHPESVRRASEVAMTLSTGRLNSFLTAIMLASFFWSGSAARRKVFEELVGTSFGK